MKTTTKLLALLTSLLILTNCFPVLAMAADSPQALGNTSIMQNRLQSIGISDTTDTPITFSMELVEDGDNPGLYGTLNYIPADTTGIYVHYSFGKEIDLSDFSISWDLTVPTDGEVPLTQLCFGMNDQPLKAYKREAVNSLYVKLSIWRKDPLEAIETETVKLSHGKTYPTPSPPPPFTANIILDNYGYYQLDGTFTAFLPNVVAVHPMYSWDGETYSVINEEYPNSWYLGDMGTDDEEAQGWLENQMCALAYEEPLKSYTANKKDKFFVRLQVDTEDGVSYNTQAAVIERGEPRPLPQDNYTRAIFPYTMRVPERYQETTYPYGQFHITARENATPEDVRALLPSTLPVEVQIVEKDTDKVLTSGKVSCAVTWNNLPPLNLTAGEAQTITDVAGKLTVPAKAQVVTPLGIYILPNAVTFEKPGVNDEIQLVINAIANDQKPDVSLSIREEDNILKDGRTLTLAFREKPSGATSIKAYSVVGESTRTEIGNLLDLRDLNHNQSAQLYGYVTLLRPDEYPLSDYLEGKLLDRFSIELEIIGGIFDGESVTLPVPSVDDEPPDELPEEIFEPDSSQGNPGNVGSEDGDNGSVDNGGQRPNLPDNGHTSPDIEVPPPPQALEQAPSSTAVGPLPEVVTADDTAPPLTIADAQPTVDYESIPSVSMADEAITLAQEQPPQRGSFSTVKLALLSTVLAGGGITAAAAVSTSIGMSPFAWYSKLTNILKKLLLRG